jgi:hypothetical protein
VAERDHMGNGHRYRGGVTAMAHTGAVAGCRSNTWYATHVREGGMHSHSRGCKARMLWVIWYLISVCGFKGFKGDCWNAFSHAPGAANGPQFGWLWVIWYPGMRSHTRGCKWGAARMVVGHMVSISDR